MNWVRKTNIISVGSLKPMQIYSPSYTEKRSVLEDGKPERLIVIIQPVRKIWQPL